MSRKSEMGGGTKRSSGPKVRASTVSVRRWVMDELVAAATKDVRPDGRVTHGAITPSGVLELEEKMTTSLQP